MFNEETTLLDPPPLPQILPTLPSTPTPPYSAPSKPIDVGITGLRWIELSTSAVASEILLPVFHTRWRATPPCHTVYKPSLHVPISMTLLCIIVLYLYLTSPIVIKVFESKQGLISGWNSAKNYCYLGTCIPLRNLRSKRAKRECPSIDCKHRLPWLL